MVVTFEVGWATGQELILAQKWQEDIFVPKRLFN
jgi:hypothetical protein